jgi:hypothetical protein
VHGVVPVFVTVTRPVIVPAAPCDDPAAAEMWLHAGEAAAVELVVVPLVVDVVDDEVVVA